jgi:transposase-like protein
MIIFPTDELMDEQHCYNFLLTMLHPEGLHCPDGHLLPIGQAPHRKNRDPFFDYRCRVCGKVYNIFTDTVLSGISYSCVTVVLILRGITQGVPTKHLAEELGIDRANLGRLRHKIQGSSCVSSW